MGNARNLADLLGTSTKANQVISTSGAITTTGAFTSVGIDDNADATALTIDSSEKLGIGTASPQDPLHTYLASGQRVARFEANDSTSAHIAFKASNTSLMPTVGVKDEDLYFSTGDAVERARFDADSNGDLILQTGNLVIGTSGKGIDFSATSDGSGANQAEVLDDYEEGTWTPTLSNGGSVTINAAVYTKIGNLIRVGTYLALSSIPNDSNTFYIAGLPYNVSYTAGGGNDHYHGAGSITYVGSHNIAGFGMLPPTPYTGQASMYFHRGDGSSSVVRNSDVTGMPYIIVATSYMTA